MVGVGFGEMVIIAGVALVVIGPDRFPDFAKIVLRTVRDLRGYVEEAKRDITEELKPVKKEIEDLSRHRPEEYLESLADSVMGDDDEGDGDGDGADGDGEDGEGDDVYDAAGYVGAEDEGYGAEDEGDAGSDMGDSEAEGDENPAPVFDAAPEAERHEDTETAPEMPERVDD